MSLENKRCDLHVHSLASDGTFTPTQLVIAAKEQGLTIALTDHNGTDGLSEFLAAAEKYGVEAVPGAEISADCGGKEMHILALFVPESAYDAVNEFTAEMRRYKIEGNRELARRLTEAGYPVDIDKIIADYPDSYINRSHIARELVRLGYVRDVDEAFDTLLSKKMGYYVPCPKPTAEDTVAFIKSIGAVPVIAHPYLKFTTEELDEFIPRAKKLGLAGMETSYSEYTPETQAEAEATALRHGLLFSGGSDFHGSAKAHISLGTGMGDLFVPYEYYLKLKEYADA